MSPVGIAGNVESTTVTGTCTVVQTPDGTFELRNTSNSGASIIQIDPATGKVVNDGIHSVGIDKKDVPSEIKIGETTFVAKREQEVL